MKNRVAALCLASLLVLILLLSGSPGLARNGSGHITGRVVDRTTQERAVPGQLVFLDMTTAAGEMSPERDSTRTNAQGVFAFDSLAVSDSNAYILFTDYHLARYVEGPIVLGPDTTARQVDLAVCDSTSRSDDVLVDRHHVIMQPISDSLLVQEFLRLVNVGTRTFVGLPRHDSEQRETIRLSLPPGASELELLAGLEQASISTDHLLVSDSEPFPPGPRQILYSYLLPLRENTAWYRTTLSYHHEGIDVFVPLHGAVIFTSDLAYVGEFGDEQTRYARYSAKDIPPGRELAFSVVLEPSKNRSLKWIPVAGLAILFFFVVRSALRHRSKSVASPAGRSRTDLERKKKNLIQAIAALDERFEDGELDQDLYKQHRAELKSELASLMQEMNQPVRSREE